MTNKNKENADSLNTAICAMLTIDGASEEFLRRVRQHFMCWVETINQDLKAKERTNVFETETRKTRRPRMSSDLVQCKLHGFHPIVTGCTHCYLLQNSLKKAL